MDTPHPSYFELFNPVPKTMGLAADALVASFNPQLAAWSHNPFAVEIEQHLVRALGSYFSYSAGVVDRVFASSGMKHNHTAILAALTNRFPEFATKKTLRAPGIACFLLFFQKRSLLR